MLKSQIHKDTAKTQQGNAIVITLVAVVVIAVGALAFFSGKITGDAAQEITAQEPASETTAAADQTPAAGESEQEEEASTQTAEAAPEEQTVIEPGNPVVAKVNGEEINRIDVFNYIQTLPAETRQLPVTQLFPLALDQVVNSKIIGDKVDDVDLDNDPQVQEQLEAAKEQIVRTVYLQKEVEKGITEERMQEAYDAYKEAFQEVEEIRARHILVDEESKAKQLIKELKDGASFEELAKENSKDGTAENGGDLGYFVTSEVVPEFGEVANELSEGEMTQKPVESQFGYHIIKIEDKRMREAASFEQAKPFLEGQLRRAVLDKLVRDWRDEADIVRYDINGNEIEPASGEEEPPAEESAE